MGAKSSWFGLISFHQNQYKKKITLIQNTFWIVTPRIKHAIRCYGKVPKTSRVTVLWLDGCGSDRVITFQKNNSLYALPTLIPGHQEETHLRKPQTFHDACSLSLSLSANVHSSRKLSLPPLQLDCCSVSCGLALTCSQKWRNMHTECLWNPTVFPLLLIRLNSLCMYLIHDQMDPPSKAALRMSFLTILLFLFSCSNFPLGLFFVTLMALQNILSYSCSVLGKTKYSALYQF